MTSEKCLKHLFCQKKKSSSSDSVFNVCIFFIVGFKMGHFQFESSYYTILRFDFYMKSVIIPIFILVNSITYSGIGILSTQTLDTMMTSAERTLSHPCFRMKEGMQLLIISNVWREVIHCCDM